MKDIARSLYRLFQGLERAYGVYLLKESKGPGKKKGKAFTRHEPYTIEKWEDHLTGKTGLGVIPINDNNKCWWGAIDIDRYDIDFKDIISKLDGTPLIPARTKSGGLHIFVFFTSPVSAGVVKSKLGDIATAMGFGGSEIFPKQSRVSAERGDIGNWLNMPYYEGKSTNRHGWTYDMKPMSALEFITLAKEQRLTATSFKALSIAPIAKDETEIVDGPPCLQQLTTIGFPPGTMNISLLNLGVYYKRAFPASWEEKISDANQKWMAPGSVEEVAQIVRSLKKKDYEFQCQQEPMCSHCDRATCENRKYGVSTGESRLPQMKNLCKMLTDPPQYFLDVDDVRIGPIDSDVLLSQTKFQKKVFEATGLVVPMIKGFRWQSILQKLSDEGTEVEVAEDNSAMGQMFEHLEIFLTGPKVTEDKDLILTGRVFIDVDKYHFRMKDFMEHLGRVRFNEFKTHSIAAMFRKQGMTAKAFKVKGKCVNCWMTEVESIQGKLDVPEDMEQAY